MEEIPVNKQEHAWVMHNNESTFTETSEKIKKINWDKLIDFTLLESFWRVAEAIAHELFIDSNLLGTMLTLIWILAQWHKVFSVKKYLQSDSRLFFGFSRQHK